jgi:DNA-3-methyladenine glycosylase II
MNPKELLSQSDPVLAAIIRQIPEPEIITTGLVFHDLASCILEQQIHYRSTKKIFQRLLERAQIEFLTPENFSVFEEKALGSLKLSEAKYKTMLDLCQWWSENQVDWHRMTDEEVRAQLKSIAGIGSWTVDMVLLYTLERKNVFPIDDFHLKQIMSTLYAFSDSESVKKQMIAVANRWADQRSLAVKYLLAWKVYQKKQRP